MKDESAREFLQTFKFALNDYVLPAQNRLQIPQQYCIISKEEQNWAQMIIEGLKDEIEKDFLVGQVNLPVTKKKGMFTKYNHNEWRLMCMLCDYLPCHQADYEFLGNRIINENLGKKNYLTQYSLTDQGVTLQKLFYITYIYCKKCDEINPSGKLYRNESRIATAIDSRIVSVP